MIKQEDLKQNSELKGGCISNCGRLNSHKPAFRPNAEIINLKALIPHILGIGVKATIELHP